VGLGDLPRGGFESGTLAVSADGSVLVGADTSADMSQMYAFIWDQANGMRSLYDLLAPDVDLSDWSLTSARGISADGLTIVGYGINPGGNTEAWMATVNPVPVPGAALLGAIGLSFAGWRLRRKAS
jgi:uncharacterized membrane protein